jgi:hypothetical protein
MFIVADRDRLRARLLDRARTDERIVAAAAVGSSASGGDRWSDLDLTFAVADGECVPQVLAEWTEWLGRETGAVRLFDLPLGETIYRVFLLPRLLQVDLSFSPAASFGARGPRFHLLFGEAAELPAGAPAPPIDHLIGMAIHHLVRVRICLERDRLWQADYWLHEARDLGMEAACRRLGEPSQHGRGLDALPLDLREDWTASLVGTLTEAALERSLMAVVRGVRREARLRPDLDGGLTRLLDRLLAGD